MRLLLDSHTFLWFADGNQKIQKNVIELIENNENQKFISMASVWEIAVKIKIGKLKLNEDFHLFFEKDLIANGFEILPIEFNHISKTMELPFHHRDPFDRLLISQSLYEQIPIISADKKFDNYGVKRIW